MKLAHIITNESITIFADGKVRTIRPDHRNFLNVRAALWTGNHSDVLAMIDEIRVRAEQVVAATKGFLIDGGNVSYDGLILNGVLSEKLISIILAGGKDCVSIRNFVDKVLCNPSPNSAMQLYDFMGYRELAITPEGNVLAFKGVQSNLYSVFGNKKTRVLQGKVDEEGHILNEIGATIECHRLSVDDNRYNECSHGLHMGSYAYAKGWGSRLLLVELDPKDAVSVPTDASFQKLRACKYRVVQEMTGKVEITTPVVDASVPVPTQDATDVGPAKETPEAVYKDMRDSKYNPWNEADRVQIEGFLVGRAYLSQQDARDFVLKARDAEVLMKIRAYKSKKNPKSQGSVRQIHSSLKIKGLTQNDITRIILANK